MRLFVAFDVPDEAVAYIQEAQQKVKQFVKADRWQPIHNLHLTLHFLGEVNDDLVPLICEDMKIVSSIIQPFTLVLGQFGAFPSPERPRVLWLGLEGNLKSLTQTHELLGKRFDLRQGLEYDTRSYKPHITLARGPHTKNGALPLEEWNREILTELPPRWQVNRINLYRSELKATGAVHTIIHSAELAHNVLA
ncbi:RNA 2',3'-cyclic phosphodiesterase [Brevibacillus ginsengisoli]|uniref:RNA 2',3'-cyclic phosphodiesterase n=1 Tax=Brevibacillus ginsengisoli TaxID=363854 RepID=UPI003CEB5E08